MGHLEGGASIAIIVAVILARRRVRVTVFAVMTAQAIMFGLGPVEFSAV